MIFARSINIPRFIAGNPVNLRDSLRAIIRNHSVNHVFGKGADVAPAFTHYKFI